MMESLPKTSGQGPRGPRPSLAPTRVLLYFACALLGSCATVDFDYPRTPSTSLQDTDDTRMGRALHELPQITAGQSGFALIEDGIDALAFRLIMADRAERSIDTQYYLINDDQAGRLFLDALLSAADRGVRVRLLLDDILTTGYDEGMRALDAHPNIEMRLFNPFANRRWRFLDGITSFVRVNRRMHNKSFTIDNQATVIGGRNIGDEYFAAREDSNFGDLDVFAIGPVVREVSSMFDAYWNHEGALPVAALTGEAEEPEVELEALRRWIDEGLQGVESSRYGEALTSTILDVTTRSSDELTWCPYELVADSPDKANHERAGDAGSILNPLAEALDQAREDVMIVTPYFVPLEGGQAFLVDLVERGVRVRVVTNSLAANNHSVVHSGYARARRPLLREGVELYEVRADAPVSGTERSGLASSRATLHTKSFAVDRARLFIGSFNFDPRSVRLNTEMGIFLDAPDMVAEVLQRFESALPRATWQVTLADQGYLRWVTWSDGEQDVRTSEPDVGFFRRLMVDLMRMLPIRSQL